MQIVIDIPDEVYEEIMAHYRENPEEIKSAYYFERLALNGTPLPKGHGRLIDADALTEKASEIQEYLDVLAPTIIEADKESESE